MLTALVPALILGQSGFSVTKTRVVDVKVLNVAPRSASQFVASLEDNSVRLMDAASGATLRTFTGHPQPVFGLAFNTAGTTLATGDESARIFLWDVKTGKKVKEFPRANAHTRGIVSLSFSPDGKQLASTGRDDFIIIWDVATAKPVRKIPGDGHNVAAGTYNPKSSAFYAATLGAGLQIYNRSGWAANKVEGHGGLGTADFALNPAGTRAATGGRDNAVAVWDLTKRSRMASLKGHEDWVMRVALAPNGAYVASSSSDRTVRVWDLKSFKSVVTLADQSSVGAPVCFTADGKFLITANINDSLQINAVKPAQAAAAAKAPTRRRR